MKHKENKEFCLIVSWTSASFVKGDVKILEEKYHPVHLKPRYSKGAAMFLGQLEMLFLLLWYMPRSKFVLVWFADYHSVLPLLISRILYKPSFLVIGGYDAANLPEINYGGHIHPFRRWCIGQSCCFATKILPVSFFAKNSLERNLSFNISGKTEVIYNGANLNTMRIIPSVLRRPLVATICGGNSIERLIVKGIDFFLDVAKDNLQIEFLIIGASGEALDWINNRKTPNVSLEPFILHEEMPGKLNQVAVICQFSRYEAFGLGLLEGMSCGCIPIGCSFSATKELIDDTSGLVINKLDLEEGNGAVRQALASVSPERSIELSEHVKKKFGIEKRSKALHLLFSKLSD